MKTPNSGKNASETITRLIEDGEGNLLTERTLVDSTGARIAKTIIHCADGRYFTQTIQDGGFGRTIQEQSHDGKGRTSSVKTSVHKDGVFEQEVVTWDKDELGTSSKITRDRKGNETYFYTEDKRGVHSGVSKSTVAQADGTRLQTITCFGSDGVKHSDAKTLLPSSPSEGGTAP